ncbi:hypothetical protein PanWU01x14_253320 [Parasponia andersonii]|uniref:Uncharacterized protein n=1 Tax=Parasponia andersonii TaxID=3476 RepID=A0A2P5BBP0_PARAD|nr:hypothetical protein PanWU01x14_253320 [Parasponia andersonii]
MVDYGDSKASRYSSEVADNCDDFGVLIFTGCLNTDGIWVWIEEVDELFESIHILSEREAKLVAKKFRGEAEIWWKRPQIDRINRGKPPIRTWKRMKKKLIRRYLPLL